MGDNYKVIEVTPTTSTAFPAAPLIAIPEGALTFNPWASAQAFVTRVTAAPVSIIMAPLVAAVRVAEESSSHLEVCAPPSGVTATLMWGCWCWMLAV